MFNVCSTLINLSFIEIGLGLGMLMSMAVLFFLKMCMVKSQNTEKSQW